MELILPENVKNALERLGAKGIPAYVVGGAVRDGLLGRPTHDWDLTAACLPQQLQAALPQAKPIGGAYGTVSFHGVEITPCRAEAGYSDHRHPDAVTFGGSVESDLARRDFTINAMAWDGTALLDPYGGQRDLQARVLRCVGEPCRRFEEDALRILRLYRFAAQLEFVPEPETEAAARQLAPSLRGVSAQRVRSELGRALAGPHPAALEPLVAAGGLAAFGIPFDWTARHPGLLAALDAVPNDPLCRWWALCRLTGASFQAVTEALGFGRPFLRRLNALNTLQLRGVPNSVRAVKLHLCEGAPLDYGLCLACFAALDARWFAVQGYYDALLASGEPYRLQDLAISAPALLALGAPPPRLHKLQMELLKAAIDTPALNTEQTMQALARQLLELQ